MNFIQYLNENQQVKTMTIVADPENYDTSINVYKISGINESFFILALFLDNVKQSSVDFVNTSNVDQLSIINDNFTDIELINLNSFFPPQTDVKISIRKEYVTKGLQKQVIYPFKKPYFKDQNEPLDPYIEDEFLMRASIVLDFNTTTNKLQDYRDFQNGKSNNTNMYYILTPRTSCTRFNDLYIKIDSSFTNVPFQGPFKRVKVVFWLDFRTNEVYISVLPSGTYVPIVLKSDTVEYTANGFKLVHADTGTNIEVSDIWF